MPKSLLIFILIGIGELVNAQVKYDYIWLYGQGINPSSDSIFGITEFNFNKNPIQSYKGRLSLNFASSTLLMSDSTGKLQFFSNGCRLMSWNDQLMKNGDTLNPGKGFINNCTDTPNLSDYGGVFTFLSLPKPNQKDKYVVFHNSRVFKQLDTLYDYVSEGLGYSEIDMQKQDRFGEVVKKNVSVLKDTVLYGCYYANKHANNRDWWVICKKKYSNKWHKVLVTPDSIYRVSSQDIGLVDNQKGSGSSQFYFSKNGLKFATSNKWEGIQVFDFNRSTGEFSNPIYLELKDSIATGGCSFSPSGRFLYVSNSWKVFQFDLEAADIQSSKTVVAEWDKFLINNFFPTNLGQIFHGPDCKLYISTIGSSQYLHVINHPDRKGTECNLVQRAIKLTWYYWQTPHFPHYRTGTPYENFCDTLTSVGTPILYFPPTAQVYPNPAQDILKLDVLGQQGWKWGIFRLYDLTGREILQEAVYPYSGEQTLSISHLLSGTYIWNLTLDGYGLQSGKVVKE